MKRIIYVVHERSTIGHFTALQSYASQKNIEIKFREFLILRGFIKSIIKLDGRLFIKQITNFLFFITMNFSRGQIIVLGIAPFDFHLPFVTFFFRKHSVFYFTSWSEWSGKFLPKKKFSKLKLIKKSWSNFLTKEIRGAFCVTNASAKSIRENFEISCPIVVVGHSVDSSIPINKSLIRTRRKGRVNLIYVGRLVKNKGIKELLTLIKGLDREKYTLKIIGDGPLRSFVEQASSAVTNIKYFGYINSKKKLFDLLCTSDIQLLFSKKTKNNDWEELFGMVIVDAMYCGVATIATNHTGPKSIIDDRTNGFLIDEDDIIASTNIILEEGLFKKDEFILAAQIKARQFYKSSLSLKWGEILDNYF